MGCVAQISPNVWQCVAVRRRFRAKVGVFWQTLIRGFHCAYENITAKRIAEWYSGLDGQAEKDVRAFLRVATPSDPLLRKAFGRILAQEMSPELSQREGVEARDVILRGGRGRPWTTLRDAFMLTAIHAANDWTRIPLHSIDGCIARAAKMFGVQAGTGSRRRSKGGTKMRERI